MPQERKGYRLVLGFVWVVKNRHARDKVSSGDTVLSMNAFWNFFDTLLGLGAEPKDLTFVQISLRGIIVFLATLIMVRLGHKRSLAHKTPFDAVLLVILASVLSRAINGSAAFFATLGGGLVLVVLHRAFAHLAYYSHRFGIRSEEHTSELQSQSNLVCRL